MIRHICFFVASAIIAYSTAASAEVSPARLVLQAGLRAQAAGNGPDLMRAAEDLDHLGAHPADGTADLAAEWRRQAEVLGVSVTNRPLRGRTLGPAYKKGRIAAHSIFTTRQTFNAGQKAEVSVVTAENILLDLSVNDDGDSEACHLTIAGGAASCGWVPVWTGAYVIHIENSADSDAAFYLVTN